MLKTKQQNEIIEEDEKFNNNLTTIAISRKNRFILQRMGGAGESFNDVLNRLLKNQMLESDSRVGTRDIQTLTRTNTPSVKRSY